MVEDNLSQLPQELSKGSMDLTWTSLYANTTVLIHLVLISCMYLRLITKGWAVRAHMGQWPWVGQSGLT